MGRTARALSWLVIAVCVGVALIGCPSNPTPRCAPGCPADLVCDRGYCISGVAPDATSATTDAAVPCGAPLLVCEARCIDPRSDRDHCGRCGVRCRDRTDACVEGRCAEEEDE